MAQPVYNTYGTPQHIIFRPTVKLCCPTVAGQWRVCLNAVSSSARIYIIQPVHNTYGTQHIIFRSTAAKLCCPTVAGLWPFSASTLYRRQPGFILYTAGWHATCDFQPHCKAVLPDCCWSVASASTLYRRQPGFILYTAGLHTIHGSVSLEMLSGCVLCRVLFPCETRFTISCETFDVTAFADGNCCC